MIHRRRPWGALPLLVLALVLGASCTKKKDKKKAEGGDLQALQPRAATMEAARPRPAQRPVMRPVMRPTMARAAVAAMRPVMAGPDSMAAPLPMPRIASRPAASTRLVPPRKAALTPAKPGPAFIAVRAGLAVLDGGKLRRVFDKWASDIQVAPDGTVWAKAIGGIFRIKGGQATKVTGSGSFSSSQAIAVGKKGELYAASYREIGVYDGATWSKEPLTSVGTLKHVKSMVVDTVGRLWLASYEKVFVKEAGKWRETAAAKQITGKPYFDKIIAGPDGSVFVSSMRALLRFHKGQWSTIALDSRPQHPVITRDGRIIFHSGMAKITILGPKPGQRRELTPGSAGFVARWIHAFAHDAAGRLWLGTEAGVYVLGPDFKPLANWPSGTAPAIAGRVSHMFVQGLGPAALPKSLGQVVRGNITGNLVGPSGTAAGGAVMQICPSPSMMMFSGETPCSKGTYKQSVKTNSAGRFLFKDVPLGSYGFAAKAGAKWTITMGGSCCTQMVKGQLLNIGTMKLRK